MTLYESLTLIISFCGFAAVVISILFLARQTKLLVQSVQCDTYASVTSNLTITKQMFIEHPELRPYFYLGADIAEDDKNYRKALGIAEHLLDFFDGILLQKSPLWPEALWMKYIKDSFEKSPILCEVLRANRDWYTPELSALMEAAVPKQQSLTSVESGTRQQPPPKSSKPM